MDGLERKIILPSVIGSNMVLQQEKPVKIWGKAAPAVTIKVGIIKVSDETVARNGEVVVDDEGNWLVNLEPMKASLDKYRIIISGEETIILEDIMVGEVWLTAGQSNMQLNLQYIVDGNKYMEEASNSNIRIFYQDHVPGDRVDGDFSYSPVFDVCSGYWRKADSAENTACCSGIGYVFGITLYEKLKAKGKEVPVAIINSATGSSSIHTWLSREKIEGTPEVWNFLREKDRYKEKSEWNKAADWNFNQMSALYNHKIAPIKYLGIRGVLWYQGENDVGEEECSRYYKSALKALIEQWSCDFDGKQDGLPFIISQLAPHEYQWSKEALPGMRECVMELCGEMPESTAVIPINDIDLIWEYGTFGYKHPIHPLTKAPVGVRMAEAAMSIAYGEAREFNLAPAYEKITINGDRIVIQFGNAGSGLKIRNGEKELKGFAICGANRSFMEARARIISNNQVEVWSDEVSEPVAVTYGFTPMNSFANLCSSTDIPALPFRTDKVKSEYWHI